ncbi:hypothetical protein DPX16_9444, partial [Anabarilius grahami]
AVQPQPPEFSASVQPKSPAFSASVQPKPPAFSAFEPTPVSVGILIVYEGMSWTPIPSPSTVFAEPAPAAKVSAPDIPEPSSPACHGPAPSFTEPAPCSAEPAPALAEPAPAAATEPAPAAAAEPAPTAAEPTPVAHEPFEPLSLPRPLTLHGRPRLQTRHDGRGP